MSWEIRQGDCVTLMREMPAASVDACVTDPPYGIGFMGKAWDGAAILDAGVREQQGRIARLCYRYLWDSINGKRAPWASNPWVWIYGVRP